MDEEENFLQKYINEKNKLIEIILRIIDESEINNDEDYQSLQNHLDANQYKENKSELRLFLHLILVISLNHHRSPNFLEKIKKILTITSKFYKSIFLNEELITIFHESKPILLFLLQSNFITIDKLFPQNLDNYTEMIDTDRNYFYPELNQAIKSGIIKQLDNKNYNFKLNENIENFELNRQKGENETKLCSLIREDLIDDFIQYVHMTNLSLSSQIKRSTFETNPLFIEKDPTLIEYAAFFGSIQIVKYLKLNNVELNSSIWLYAVHSDNAEIISFLEEKYIVMDDRTFSEAIKCHHNNIARYIHDNYLTQLNDDQVYDIFSSNNFNFITEEMDEDMFLFGLNSENYKELANLYLLSKKKEIDMYINQYKSMDIDNLIIQAINDNKLIVAYHLMLDLPDFKYKFFSEKLPNITKIVLPPSIDLIDNELFRKCSKLKYISMSTSVVSLGKNSFNRCVSLTHITIPPSVKIIKKRCFRKCTSLKRVTFLSPSSLTKIGESAFSFCSSLVQINLPSSLTIIEEDAFYGCSSLTQIIIPSAVTKIGANAFRGCSSLTQFTIPSSVNFIGGYVLVDCQSLKYLEVHSTKIKIGHDLFEGCISLKQITCPSEIGDFVCYLRNVKYIWI